MLETNTTISNATHRFPSIRKNSLIPILSEYREKTNINNSRRKSNYVVDLNPKNVRGKDERHREKS